MDKSLYTRPDKPTRLTVTHRQEVPARALPVVPEPIAVNSATECHVTPDEVAERMVDYLGPQGAYLTLEPSAGTGNLIHALYRAGHSAQELVAIERSISLCSVLVKRFNSDRKIEPINECFLEYVEKAKGQIEYPRVIMNPSFKRIKAHMNAALSLLGRSGHDEATLVALVPITYQHSEMESLEELPDDTFTTTKVYTKLVRFTR